MHGMAQCYDLRTELRTVLQEASMRSAGRADGRDSQDWPAAISGTDPSHELVLLLMGTPAEVPCGDRLNNARTK